MSNTEPVVSAIRRVLVPIRPEGVPFIASLVFAALFLGWFWQPILWVGLILAAWCTYFFRDPQRVTPIESGLVVSPADGRVAGVSLEVAPKDLGLGEQMRRKVSIAMGIFDCHVNRAPIAGAVTRIAYRSGRAFDADVDKSVGGGERNGISLETEFGPVGVVQIAGIFARRIVCLTHEGDELATGERVGLIRFGSQLDVYLPVAATILVAEGQTAVAGETPIAKFGGAPSGAARRVRVD